MRTFVLCVLLATTALAQPFYTLTVSMQNPGQRYFYEGSGFLVLASYAPDPSPDEKAPLEVVYWSPTAKDATLWLKQALSQGVVHQGYVVATVGYGSLLVP